MFDCDGRGEPINPVHIGLFQTAQELTGVTAETFYVPPLTFRVERVKREAALSRTTEPSDDREFFLGNAHVDVFQIVDACAADVDLHCSF